MRVVVHTVVGWRPLWYSAHVRLCIKTSLDLDLIVSDEAHSMKLRTVNRIRAQSSQAGICCYAVILVISPGCRYQVSLIMRIQRPATGLG